MLRVTGEKKALRKLRRLRRKAVPFAIKKASDQAGRLLVTSFVQEWRRVFEVRRKTFPRSVLRVIKAGVSGERVVRNTRVISFAAHDTLVTQLLGGVRKPQRSKTFAIPVGRPRVRRNPRNYVSGKYIFQARKTGKDKLVGHFEDAVKIIRRFNERRVLNRVQRAMPRLLREAVREETRQVLLRRGA